MGYFYFIFETQFACTSVNTGKKYDNNDTYFSIWDKVSLKGTV